jgi:ribonuclease-3
MNFKKQIPNLELLEEILGYSFDNKVLLNQSLTHPSSKGSKDFNMERLEFLGDRVLGLIISEKLYLEFDDFKEGQLSKHYNHLVQRSSCVDVAKKINLENFIIIGKSEFSKKGPRDSILSNVLEAVIGAIFIDSDYNNAKSAVLRLWSDFLSHENLSKKILNPKSELQEIVLSLKKGLPVYELLTTSGKDHNPEFTVLLKVDGYDLVTAKGKTKQDAEKNSATQMLTIIKYNE